MYEFHYLGKIIRCTGWKEVEGKIIIEYGRHRLKIPKKVFKSLLIRKV